MIQVTVGPDGSVSVSLDPNWAEFLFKRFGKKIPDPSLDYRTEHVKSSYPGCVPDLVRASVAGQVVAAPYTMVIDYRKVRTNTLGRFRTVGQYTLPGELAMLQAAEVDRRRAAKTLKKGNQPVIRIANVTLDSAGSIVFDLQGATYYDQVGSNLSLDALLPPALGLDIQATPTARAWDMAQAGEPTALPSMSASKLANTIGVAVGIRTRDEYGRPAVVVRKRAPDVDVYPNMWHLPFSFALSYTPPLPAGGGRLEDLVNFDYANELEQETGLEPSDIRELRAIALCRDLVRGGKPQFFLELTTDVSFEELNRRMKRHGTDEYRGASRLLLVGKVPDFGEELGSPELLAYICLLS